MTKHLNYARSLSIILAALAALTFPGNAIATTASTIQVNCGGQNADGSGCTWKLSGAISYGWANGAHHDRGFNSLLPDPVWPFTLPDGTVVYLDLQVTISTDLNMEPGPPSINGEYWLYYYAYPYSDVHYEPDTYTIPSASLVPGVTRYAYSVFPEIDDIQDVYYEVYSGQANPEQYDSITDYALSN